mmetsp:Transcript_152647/g.387862  ORF Transcript_152647/g.387862 Transcript_152647/m.387862 type:complete len:204 (+) Transcript_152647:1121-1732(+)
MKFAIVAALLRVKAELVALTDPHIRAVPLVAARCDAVAECVAHANRVVACNARAAVDVFPPVLAHTVPGRDVAIVCPGCITRARDLARGVVEKMLAEALGVDTLSGAHRVASVAGLFAIVACESLQALALVAKTIADTNSAPGAIGAFGRDVEVRPLLTCWPRPGSIAGAIASIVADATLVAEAAAIRTEVPLVTDALAGTIA